MSTGTLAQAVSDEAVSKSLLKYGCGECITGLLESDNDGLAHRALVIAIDLVMSDGVEGKKSPGRKRHCGCTD